MENHSAYHISCTLVQLTYEYIFSPRNFPADWLLHLIKLEWTLM